VTSRRREVTVPKWTISIVVLALTLGEVALANPALGADDLPFRGSDQGGFELPGVCPGGSLEEVVIDGTGQATQLGAYTYAATECFDPVSGAFAGSSRLTAANGDELTGTYEGQVSGTADPNVIAYQEELELTGGTGRFAGATGTPGCRRGQPVHARVQPDPDRNPVEAALDLRSWIARVVMRPERKETRDETARSRR
jgi:hypothetical protein